MEEGRGLVCYPLHPYTVYLWFQWLSIDWSLFCYRRFKRNWLSHGFFFSWPWGLGSVEKQLLLWFSKVSTARIFTFVQNGEVEWDMQTSQQHGQTCSFTKTWEPFSQDYILASSHLHFQTPLCIHVNNCVYKCISQIVCTK